MLFEEMMKEEYNAGKADGLTTAIEAILLAKGSISESLKERIQAVKELEHLTRLSVIAANVNTVDEFVEELSKLGF